MGRLGIAVALAGLSLLGACADPSRSRNLGNPEVTGLTLAQQVCSNCHGVTGNAVSPNFPNLAGQTEAYTAAQLTEFKKHSRQDPAGFEYMWGLSRSLTEEQINALAGYYASQSAERQPIEGGPARIAAGKDIFDAGVPSKNVPACGSCHGAQGLGNGPMPRLASQHVDYIVKQMIVFQRTDERPDGSVMKTIAHGLTPDEIESVAAYIQTLPPS